MYLNGNSVGQDTLSGDAPLQSEWRVYDPTTNLRHLAVRLYNPGSAMVKGRVYRIAFDGDEESNPSAVAVVTLANVYQNLVVALSDVPATSWGWFAIQGYCEAFVNGDSVDVTKDDFLTVNDSTDDDAFIDDTTARTVNSFAIACEDETDSTPSLKRVYLIGDRAIIP